MDNRGLIELIRERRDLLKSMRADRPVDGSFQRLAELDRALEKHHPVSVLLTEVDRLNNLVKEKEVSCG